MLDNGLSVLRIGLAITEMLLLIFPELKMLTPGGGRAVLNATAHEHNNVYYMDGKS